MNITFIGAGNMGGAIAKGLIKSGVCANQISIVDKNVDVANYFADLGCKVGRIESDDLVVIAVKPWQIGEVAKQIGAVRGIISIVAGVSCAELEQLFGKTKIAKVIPNTPVEFLEGTTFITDYGDLVEQVVEIFSKVGRTFVVEEKILDGCTALSSCGVAYALRYARASQVGGVELGVNPKLGQQIIAQTLRGAASLLETGNHPEHEIDKVTTPGGYTIKGLIAMEKAGFTNAVIEGLRSYK